MKEIIGFIGIVLSALVVVLFIFFVCTFDVFYLKAMMITSILWYLLSLFDDKMNGDGNLQA